MSKYIISVFIVFIAFVFSSASYAQGPDADSSKSIKTDSLYFKSEALFKCDIRLPENFNPDKDNTLVIGLHGGGSTPEAFIKIWDKIKDVNFIYAAPQGPYKWLIEEKIGYDWSAWPTGDLKIIANAMKLTSNYVENLIQSLKEKYNINEVYLMGFSQGAIFTYIAGIQRPELYKGIICLSGPAIFEPLRNPFVGEYAPDWLEEKYLEPANTLRVFIAHGTEDQTPNHEYGVKSKEILTSYDYDVTFRSFESGHTIDSKILKQALEWIINK